MPPKAARKRKARDILDPIPSAEDEAGQPCQVAASTTTTVSTKENDGGPKPKRRSAKSLTPRASAPPLSRASSTASISSATSLDPVQCNVPWPASFVQLEKTYKALNLVFTFCCTRKHLATTWDTIKGTVQQQIKREVDIEEVAKIVALRPGGIRFQYVDEASLQIDVRGVEDLENFRGGRTKNFHPPHEEVYGSALPI